jgi:uncharacterized membrane protein YcaP (DUF421 family)
MKKEEIEPGDVYRILIGNAPPEFLIEVFIRTIILYLALLIIVKLLGKRMSGQVTLLEMAVMITLGGIVGSPIQLPDRGIIVGMAILVYILFFHRIIISLSCWRKAVEYVTQGKVNTLVKNGVIQIQAMNKERITQQQLFAMLRDQHIRHLGMVARAYLEAQGTLSIFKATTERPGLSTLPLEDAALIDASPAAVGQCACRRCGNLATQEGMCSECNYRHWAQAVV